MNGKITTKIILLSALFVVCALTPAGSHAQGCQGVMTSGYSGYNSQSVDNNGYIYSSVTVDGSAIIHPSPYCNISGTTHKPEIYNSLGSTGGYYFGSPVCPACYISFSNTQDILANPGTEYALNVWGEVICSAVGEIFSGGNLSGFISLHRTTYKYQSIANNICTFTVYCINSQQICGPDSVTVQGPCPYPYFITSWLKFRIGTNSTCFPGPTGVLSNNWLSCF